jgi:hypothetical protein
MIVEPDDGDAGHVVRVILDGEAQMLPSGALR